MKLYYKMLAGLRASTGSSILMNHLKNLFVLFGNIQIAESKSKFIDPVESCVNLWKKISKKSY